MNIRSYRLDARCLSVGLLLFSLKNQRCLDKTPSSAEGQVGLRRQHHRMISHHFKAPHSLNDSAATRKYEDIYRSQRNASNC